jgi:hypothetical protein
MFLVVYHRDFMILCKSLIPFPLYETCPLVYQSQVNITIRNHTKHFAVQLHSTWRLVPALNVGHLQATVQEHVNVYRNSLWHRVGDLSLVH